MSEIGKTFLSLVPPVDQNTCDQTLSVARTQYCLNIKKKFMNKYWKLAEIPQNPVYKPWAYRHISLRLIDICKHILEGLFLGALYLRRLIFGGRVLLPYF